MRLRAVLADVHDDGTLRRIDFRRAPQELGHSAAPFEKRAKRRKDALGGDAPRAQDLGNPAPAIRCDVALALGGLARALGELLELKGDLLSGVVRRSLERRIQTLERPR